MPGPVPGTRARKQSGQYMCEVLGERRGGYLINSAVRREEGGGWE